MLSFDDFTPFTTSFQLCSGHQLLIQLVSLVQKGMLSPKDYHVPVGSQERKYLEPGRSLVNV